MHFRRFPPQMRGDIWHWARHKWPMIVTKHGLTVARADDARR